MQIDLREAIAQALIEEKQKPLYAAMSGYLDGYKTGLRWTEDYKPGGPWHYAPRSTDSKEFQAKARATQENYKQWHDGFNAGFARKNKNGQRTTRIQNNS